MTISCWAWNTSNRGGGCVAAWKHSSQWISQVPSRSLFSCWIDGPRGVSHRLSHVKCQGILPWSTLRKFSGKTAVLVPKDRYHGVTSRWNCNRWGDWTQYRVLPYKIRTENKMAHFIFECIVYFRFATAPRGVWQPSPSSTLSYRGH